MAGHIKNYWESQGKQHGASHWASWGDNLMIELEIMTVAEHLKDGDSVIDIGCANGYSTFQQFERHKLSRIIGIDFAENMINAALGEREKRGITSEKIEFRIGDVRKLDFESNLFDVGYTTRVLINLPTWAEQRAAIEECLRIIRPGGKLVLSEAFWEPLCLLNAIRALKNMPPLVEHDFNRYLKKAKLIEYLESQGLVWDIIDFSSLYYLGSRFLRELVTDYAAYEGFSNPINKLFFEIEKEYSGGGFGIQQAVVISK